MRSLKIPIAALTLSVALGAPSRQSLPDILESVGISGGDIASASGALGDLGIDESTINAAIGALSGSDSAADISTVTDALTDAGVTDPLTATPAQLDEAFSILEGQGVDVDGIIPLLEAVGVVVPDSLKGVAGEGEGEKKEGEMKEGEVEKEEVTESTSENGDDDDDASCFPSSAKVELRGGESVRMDSLRIGDEVHVGDGEYSPVFLFTHAEPDFRGSFVRLRAGGQAVVVKPGHYVYSGGEALRVEDVSVGDIVVVDGKETEVDGVERVLEDGLWNPQTLHGDIEVNGFKATTYTAAVRPSLAHALLAPIRAGYRAFGVDASGPFEAVAGRVR